MTYSVQQLDAFFKYLPQKSVEQYFTVNISPPITAHYFIACLVWNLGVPSG